LGSLGCKDVCLETAGSTLILRYSTLGDAGPPIEKSQSSQSGRHGDEILSKSYVLNINRLMTIIPSEKPGACEQYSISLPFDKNKFKACL
jgi:hypothetical protein